MKEWNEMGNKGTDGTNHNINANGLDKKDKFIHLCAGRQVRRVSDLYGYPPKESILVTINADKLAHIQWDKIPNGDIYPHEYDSYIKQDAVIDVCILAKKIDNFK